MSSPAPDPAAAAGASSPRVLTGIALAVAGYVFFASQDAIVKWLVGASLPVWQILFFRSVDDPAAGQRGDAGRGDPGRDGEPAARWRWAAGPC